MAEFNKFYQYEADVHNGLHDFSNHKLKVMLTNVQPQKNHTVRANLTEIKVGNGYEAGGALITTLSSIQSDGVWRLLCKSVTFTTSGGSIGPFRYAVLYNSFHPPGPLIGWWDYGSAITLPDQSAFTVVLDHDKGVLCSS